MACKFFEMIDARWAAGARVCVGLDTDMRKLPEELLESKTSSSPQYAFNEKIIKATAKIALCYKPNLAFYRGTEGLHALRNTVAAIRTIAEGVPIILDAKYGDIDNTNESYAGSAFDWLMCDAVTVHNYMGLEAMKPFLDQGDKGVIVLCRTSNKGSGEFQDALVDINRLFDRREFAPLYQLVAHQVAAKWNYNGNCGLVVGATYPDQLQEVRALIGDMPILLPGLGAQGGNVEAAVLAGVNSTGSGIIPNSSSGIIFADDPAAAAEMLSAEISAALAKVPA